MSIKIISTLLLSLFISFPYTAHANQNQTKNLVGLGYAYINIKDAPGLQGISLKYQVKSSSDKKTGLQISGTIAQTSYESDKRLRYGSLAMGYFYQMTDVVELYGVVGLSGLSYDAKINSDSSKSVSWGSGLTVNLPYNTALMVGYEAGYFKLNNQNKLTHGIITNIGYRF